MEVRLPQLGRAQSLTGNGASKLTVWPSVDGNHLLSCPFQPLLALLSQFNRLDNQLQPDTVAVSTSSFFSPQPIRHEHGTVFFLSLRRGPSNTQTTTTMSSLLSLFHFIYFYFLKESQRGLATVVNRLFSAAVQRLLISRVRLLTTAKRPTAVRRSERKRPAGRAK